MLILPRCGLQPFGVPFFPAKASTMNYDDDEHDDDDCFADTQEVSFLVVSE